MASFPANLFSALSTLSPTGQQLLIVNNLRGIADTERAQFKALVLQNDPRMLASVEAFTMDRDVNSLLACWRSLSYDEPAEPEYVSAPLGPRLTLQETAQLLSSVYRRLGGASAYETEQTANRAAEECFDQMAGRDNKVSLEELKAWLNMDPTRSRKAKPAPVREEPVPVRALKAPTPKPAQQPQRFVATPREDPVRAAQPAPSVPKAEPIAEEEEKPRAAPKQHVTKVDPMQKIFALRDDAGLQNVAPQQIVDRVRVLFAKKEEVTEPEFVEILMSLGKPYTGARKVAKESALKQIFALMDVNSNASLDREELMNALTAISGGSEDDKIEAVFMLYDINGDGLISFEEMLKHQTAVFRMAYSVNPSLEQEMGESADTMAMVTTESIFRQLDTDQNRVISLDEFRSWFRSEVPSEEAKEERKQKTTAIAEKKAASIQPVQVPTPNLELLKETVEHLGLAGVHVADAMGVFKEHGAGIFSRQQFKDTLRTVIQQYGNAELLKESEFNEVCADLFLTFDVDQSATVDMQELFSGLSILCEGTPGEKLRVAFELYDESGDGYIQYNELMKYLCAVFRLVMARQGKADVDIEKLAEATARNCFVLNEQDVETGKLTFVQFKEWHDSIGARI